MVLGPDQKPGLGQPEIGSEAQGCYDLLLNGEYRGLNLTYQKACNLCLVIFVMMPSSMAQKQPKLFPLAQIPPSSGPGPPANNIKLSTSGVERVDISIYFSIPHHCITIFNLCSLLFNL